MISLPRASFPSALGKGRGKWKETEGRWEKTAVLRSQERGHFPGVAWWEEEGAHVDPSVILSGASLQFQGPRKYSEHRARLGWAATHLSTLHPEQEEAFSTQATVKTCLFPPLIQVCPARVCPYPRVLLGPGGGRG